MFAYTPPRSAVSGYAVVTGRFLGLVGADSGAEVAAALYRALATDAAGISDGLDLLSAASDADTFALVEIAAGPENVTLIAVRGDVVVDLDGAASSRFTWPEGAAWMTGEARDITSLRLLLSGTPANAPQLPLADGAVEASGVSMESPQAAPHVPPVLPRESTTVAAAPAGAELAESTQDAPVGREPRRVDLAQLMSSRKWTLVLPDGKELEAAPQIVVGRKPWRSSPEETSTYYIVVPSPHREVSGKHVEFAVVGGELHARDLDSTNGTLVLTPDKPPRLLHSGRAVNLDVGDTLDLGEGFRIVVGSRT